MNEQLELDLDMNIMKTYVVIGFDGKRNQVVNILAECSEDAIDIANSSLNREYRFTEAYLQKSPEANQIEEDMYG